MIKLCLFTMPKKKIRSESDSISMLREGSSISMLREASISSIDMLREGSVSSNGSVEMMRSSSSRSLELIDPNEELDKILDALYEKRSSTRIGAASRLIRFLSQNYEPQLIQERSNAIIDALLPALKSGSNLSELSCKGLVLIWVTYRQDFETYNRVTIALLTVIKNPDNAAIGPAIIAYAQLLILQNSQDDLDSLINLLETQIKVQDQDGGILAAALNALGLIYPMQPFSDEDQFVDILDWHCNLLETADVATKTIVGENIAILTEMHDFEYDHESLVEKIHSLSVESSKHIAKADRVKQKASFREIRFSLEQKRAPLIKLKFKHDTVHFDSWGLSI